MSRKDNDFSLKVKLLLPRSESNYDFSVKVKPLPTRSKSNYDFSVKVKLLSSMLPEGKVVKGVWETVRGLLVEAATCAVMG